MPAGHEVAGIRRERHRSRHLELGDQPVNPDRVAPWRFVIAGAVVSGLAPPDRPKPYLGLPLQNKVLMFGMRRSTRMVRLFRKLGHSAINGDPDAVRRRLAASFPPPDKRLLEDSHAAFMLVSAIQEGYRRGWKGPAQDDVVILNRPWGFRIEDIDTRVDIWQGALDKNVPLNHGVYQHERIPNSRLTVLPDQAHLYLLVKWREVLAALIEG